jgi:hypothetical protein
MDLFKDLSFQLFSGYVCLYPDIQNVSKLSFLLQKLISTKLLTTKTMLFAAVFLFQAGLYTSMYALSLAQRT